jgi:hypothetical protein
VLTRYNRSDAPANGWGLGLIVSLVLLAGCGAGAQDAVPVRSVVADLLDPVEVAAEQLDDELGSVRPTRRASLVSLRAAARNLGDAVDGARSELDAMITDSPQDRRVVRDSDISLERLEALADEIIGTPASPSRIEQAAADAEVVLDAANIGSWPSFDVQRLLAGLRGARRRGNESQAQTQRPEPAPAPASSAPVAFRDYTGPAFQAKMPTGAGWSDPATSEPTPGELFRTSVRGPDGQFLIVDYTPFETAKFGGSYDSTRSLGQTAFGSATEYVFQGGSLPECQRHRCVDYLINDPAASRGFGVLAGGPDFAMSSRIAQTVMESVTPVSY